MLRGFSGWSEEQSKLSVVQFTQYLPVHLLGLLRTHVRRKQLLYDWQQKQVFLCVCVCLFPTESFVPPTPGKIEVKIAERSLKCQS